MPKRTRTQDINQFAADVVRKSTESELPAPSQSVISQVMAAMGRKGGLKGAATLNARLSPAQRKVSARRAALARWGTDDNRFVSIREFVDDWAREHGHAGGCSAHKANTTDHKIIVTVVGVKDLLEIPGGADPISRKERAKIEAWLTKRLQ